MRDTGRQLEMMGVPEANLDGHAFHTYRCICRRQLRSTAANQKFRAITPVLSPLAGSKIMNSRLSDGYDVWVQPAVA